MVRAAEKIDYNREEIPEFSNREMMDDVLSLFGTEEAKERFVKLCEDYLIAFRRYKLQDVGVKISDKIRARIHNEIMDTLQRLSMAPKIKSGSKEEKVLWALADRDKVAEMIEEYFSPRRREPGTPLGRFRAGLDDHL